MRNDADRQLQRLAELTDSRIREAIAGQASTAADRLRAMLEYHFGWRDEELRALGRPAPSGKKLRPGLVLLACQAVCGEVTPSALNAAAAVELIHNFSLIHDDIQDRSQLRRHRRTVWSLWGVAQGINAGDALFALAQVVVLREGSQLAAQMAAELNATALHLSEGQFLDIDLQSGASPASLEVYESMIACKTGALFASACRLGAMAGGAPPASEATYAAFGLELGLAFQEQDDLLGVWGSSSETGKPNAADVVERKRGLPAVMALSQTDAPEWLRRLYAEDDAISADIIARVIAHFDWLGLRAAIEARVERRYRSALECLAAAGAGEPARGYLAAISEALVSRRT